MTEAVGKERKPWIEFDKERGPINQRIREAAKWLLDLIRNVAVVGAISYFARVSDSAVLEWVSIIGLGCLSVYLWSYVEQTRFNRLFANMRNQHLATALNIAVLLIFVGGGFLFLSLGASVAVREIAEAYGMPPIANE